VSEVQSRLDAYQQHERGSQDDRSIQAALLHVLRSMRTQEARLDMVHRKKETELMPAHCKTNADIEVFPERMLCPQCKEGRLMLGNMSGKSIQVGPHWRFAQHKCNRCGWTKRMAREYFGVEEPDPVTTSEASADGVRHLVG